MSIEAINAAWLADVRPASKKLVLLCLANMHNGQTGQLNPSVAAVAMACGISEKQARRQIHELMQAGLVEVVGNHAGGNPKATRHYRLNLGEVIHTPPADVTPPASVTPPMDGSRPLPPVGVDPSRPCPLPLPPVGAKPERTGIEPEWNQKKARKRAAVIECPADVDQKVWDGFLAIRKAKRSPLSEIALEGIKREASKAGMSLEDALRTCCEKGWQGFSADWVQGRQSGSFASNGRRMPALENFSKKNYGTGGLL